MADMFEVNIFTPERLFFSENVEILEVELSDGRAQFMAHHMPFVAPVAVATTRIKKENGEWVVAFSSEGFIDVRRDGVMMFVQTCEWPDEIDINRAEAARIKAEEALRQKRSMSEYQKSKIDLARAMERLRITRDRGIGRR